MEKLLYDWTSGTGTLMKAVANVPSFIRSNFLLKGNSAEMLRRVALDVSKTIQDENQIPFTGVMKSFALRVPAASSYEGASNILEALMSSVEHAAGYYSVYKGIIILELDQDWLQIKDLSALREYMNYVQANRDYICFNIIRLRHSEEELKMICKKLPHDSEAYNNIQTVVSLGAKKIKSCILSTFDQLMRIFMTAPGLTKMLSEQTFRINQLGERKAAIFVIVPDVPLIFEYGISEKSYCTAH